MTYYKWEHTNTLQYDNGSMTYIK